MESNLLSSGEGLGPLGVASLHRELNSSSPAPRWPGQERPAAQFAIGTNLSGPARTAHSLDTGQTVRNSRNAQTGCLPQVCGNHNRPQVEAEVCGVRKNRPELMSALPKLLQLSPREALLLLCGGMQNVAVGLVIGFGITEVVVDLVMEPRQVGQSAVWENEGRGRLSPRGQRNAFDSLSPRAPMLIRGNLCQLSSHVGVLHYCTQHSNVIEGIVDPPLQVDTFGLLASLQ